MKWITHKKMLIAFGVLCVLAALAVWPPGVRAQSNTTPTAVAVAADPGVQLTPDQVQKLDSSITTLIPLVPSKYQGLVAGAILLLGLASKFGRLIVGYKTGGWWGAVKSVFTGSATAAKLLLCLALPALLMTTGCNGHVAHAVGASANGWDAGITENAETGAYELGAKNVDGSVMVVPILYQTNQEGTITAIVPDAVMSNEKGAKASFFGSGSQTVTIAFGSNAVNSLLGGQHWPINSPYWTNSAVAVAFNTTGSGTNAVASTNSASGK